MRRIAILDHDTHNLYVEDIDEEVLERLYEGEEERYIEDSYNVENYSWDYIMESYYFTKGESLPLDINFEDFV